MRLFKKLVIDSIQSFIKDSRAIGILLLICTVISLLLSNMGLTKDLYASFWKQSFSGLPSDHYYTIHFLSLPNSLMVVINDLLMAVFFFLAGMEIRREIHHGELSSFKKSLVPIVAAIGGMIAPAFLFTQFNKGTDNLNGWAIPMATDIAFTLGVASLLGNKVPVSLKIFLTALAIIDDLGAILVIAFFYGGHLRLLYVLLSVIILFSLYVLQTKKKPFGMVYMILGLVLWYCLFNSGIHATVAGVLFAFFIPIDSLGRLEAQLHAPVYFIIIPIFALANTAISISSNTLDVFNGPLTWGIIAGLCIGKPLGIVSAVFYLVKRKWAKLPKEINWQHLIGAGFLAGIGFTMSIFISALAFEQNFEKDQIAKLSVLIASLISMIVGYLWLNIVYKTNQSNITNYS